MQAHRRILLGCCTLLCVVSLYYLFLLLVAKVYEFVVNAEFVEQVSHRIVKRLAFAIVRLENPVHPLVL